MNAVGDVSVLPTVLTSILVLGGAAITLIGSFGLIRLGGSFYQRVHAPTLGTTLGTACVALGSMTYFSALGNRFAVHELLIVVFITLTTPISLMVLVRAAVLRDSFESERDMSEQVEKEQPEKSAFGGNDKNINVE